MSEVIDPGEFLTDGMFRQDDFLHKISMKDWAPLANKNVLVRGCDSAVIPPWAYMIITAKLAGIARTVRFGNEHDNVVVMRKEGV